MNTTLLIIIVFIFNGICIAYILPSLPRESFRVGAEFPLVAARILSRGRRIHKFHIPKTNLAFRTETP